MISLRRIHHVCLRVAQLDEAARRWSIQFGLTVRSLEQGRALLACDYEPYALELVATERDAASPGHDHTAWELAAGVSLDDAAAHLTALGVAHRRDGDCLRLSDPDRAGVELVPYAADTDRRPAFARSTTTVPGFHPRRLGHANVLTGELSTMVEFYCDALGMRITDRLGGEGTWLHIDREHHAMALVAKGYPHLHHFAFELVDWGELRVALDHLAQHGRRLGWGPVRHGIGGNLAAYVRIPEEECFVELFCDMERLEQDHVPRDWPDDAHSSNTWGIMPPRSYFRFDPVAVEWEREGREALGERLPPLQGAAR
ncbi:MAG: VOC family protein [Solirubrobacteraceae bacterium]